MINSNHFITEAKKNVCQDPFWHTTIPNMLPPELADELESDFPAFESPKWYSYSNAIEEKKALNNWNEYPPSTYKLLNYLNGPVFATDLDAVCQIPKIHLYADPGLHGGGWHIHGRGGKLNPHLDYSIHPKLGLQRKLNLIIYLCRDWKEEYGGHFGLWKRDEATGKAGELVKEIPVGFNTAVLFDTTQNAWHGLSREVTAPTGVYRKSLAIYYLCDPLANADRRGRALFAPTEAQKNDPGVERLIQARADVKTSLNVYRTDSERNK